MFLGNLEIDSRNKNKVLTKLHVSIKPFQKSTTSITCQIDTGAEVNAISKTNYDKIGLPQVLTAYGGQTINCIDMWELYIHRNNDTKPAAFAVTDMQGPTMLACTTCHELYPVTINSSIEKETTKTETGGSKQDNTRLPKEPQVIQALSKDEVVSDYKTSLKGKEHSKWNPDT